MNTKKSQRDIIRQRLIETGQVSRNWALQNYISRLSGRIYDLIHEEGMDIRGRWVKTNYGKDFVYELQK